MMNHVQNDIEILENFLIKFRDSASFNPSEKQYKYMEKLKAISAGKCRAFNIELDDLVSYSTNHA